MKLNGIIALIYGVLQLSFIGLINIPYLGFIFAAIYLLISLFILSILSNSNALNSQVRVFTSNNPSFSPDFDVKKAYSKYKENSFSSLFGSSKSRNKNSKNNKYKHSTKNSSYKNPSIKPSKFGQDAKDVEFKEK